MRSRPLASSLPLWRALPCAECVCLALLLSACGDDATDTSADTGVTGDTSVADGSFTPSGYPA
ncbi:MAG: hypothetical protein KGO50_11410, partial [Myxococcales bacterium]|nr:hypothetical protein [Myxococcales bacterium]